MRNDCDMDRRADELRQLFEEKGLALLLAPAEEDELTEDEQEERLDRRMEEIERIADEMHQLSGASDAVVKAKMTVAYFWSKGNAIIDLNAYKFFQDVAAATIGPFKVRVDETLRRLGYRENWE